MQPLSGVAESMKSISVAIGYPDRQDQWALLKAAALAERCGARLTLVHTFSLPYPLSGSDYRSGAELVREAIENRREQLAALVERLGLRHRRIDYRVLWDVPVAAAIVRDVLRRKPDLLLADSHRHGRIGRLLLNNTDWELMRSFPGPLWFVKSPSLATRPRILAAVDPVHADADHSGLDDEILGLARRLQRDCDATLMLGHILEGREPRPAHDAVARLARRHRVGSAPRVFAAGEPATALPALATAEEADVVLMGVVSRRARDMAFIGGTAERAIDALRCDVIVVKPRRFITDISPVPALRVEK